MLVVAQSKGTVLQNVGGVRQVSREWQKVSKTSNFSVYFSQKTNKKTRSTTDYPKLTIPKRALGVRYNKVEAANRAANWPL